MNEQRHTIHKVDLDLTCPICNKGKLQMIYKVTEIPYFGGIVAMTIRCNNCSLKLTDLIAVSDKGNLPIKHERKTLRGHMSDLVVLSSGSRIEIPEIGAEIYVSRESGGEITTIEGVLMDLRDKITSMLNNASDNEKEKITSILNIINDELHNPSGKLSVVIIDENKRSAIIPNELWLGRVEKERTRMLKINESELIKIGKDIIKDYI